MADLFGKLRKIERHIKQLGILKTNKKRRYVQTQKKTVQKKAVTTQKRRELTPEEKARIQKIRAEKAKLEQEALKAEKKTEEIVVCEENEKETDHVQEEQKAVTTYSSGTNKVLLTGVFKSGFVFSFERKESRIYTAEFSVKRTSGVEDVIQVNALEEMLDLNVDYTGRKATIEGQFRSRNSRMTDKYLILYVFAKSIDLLDEEELLLPENNIELRGYICKPPVYRETARGRVICDVLLGVRRTYQKTDYIPCIFWGRNAKYVKDFEVGTELELEGRIQSREYMKKTEEKEEMMIAYEVSVNEVGKKEQNTSL